MNMPINTNRPDSALNGRFALIIPVYNHLQKVREVVLASKKLNIPIFVIDDGSTDGAYDRIKAIEDIHILRHKVNRGKGAAILTGMLAARAIADWAITLDADGQHNPADALKLIRTIPTQKIQSGQRPIIVGKRQGMAGAGVPWTSRYGRKFSNFWVWLSGGPLMNDSQSGFRIYPLPETLNLNVAARRFQFEIEILVKARWNMIPVYEAPVSVNYRPGVKRISHFRPFTDFMRNTGVFTRLIFQRVVFPNSMRLR